MKHRILLVFDANKTLAGSGYASRPDRFARNPGSQLTLRDWARYHAPGTDDRLIGDIGHNDASSTDPAISSDENLSRLSGLVTNRNIQAIKRMGLGTGRNLHARPQQRVIADRYPTQLAIRSNINVFAKSRIGLGQQRPVSNKNRRVALAQYLGKKNRTH
jgi:hypothetical protein